MPIPNFQTFLLPTLKFCGDKKEHSAKEYVNNLPNTKVVLIDGEELTKLMIEYSVGISIKKVYEIKKIDIDYFIEDE